MSNQKRTGRCFDVTLPLDMRIYLSLGSMLDIITLTMYLKSECLILCNYGHFIFFYSLVFRWLAIPWLQSELDKWVTIRNRTLPRADTKKVLPHGIPELMREKPEQFGALDFKVIGCSIHLFSSFFAQHQTRFLFQQSSSTALKQNLPLPTTRSFSLHPPHSMSVRVISMLASGLL